MKTIENLRKNKGKKRCPRINWITPETMNKRMIDLKLFCVYLTIKQAEFKAKNNKD